MCECYQIGGRFIAEDPDCPVHGQQSVADRKERRVLISRLEAALVCEDPDVVARGLQEAIDYLESLQ